MEGVLFVIWRRKYSATEDSFCSVILQWFYKRLHLPWPSNHGGLDIRNRTI